MKHKRERKDSPAPAPKPPQFANTALRDALKQLKKAPPPEPPKAPPPPALRRSPPPAPAEPTSDEQLFASAMHDVVPLPRALGERGEPAKARPRVADVNEDAESLATLAELVATGEGFDLADTDEYMEGLARGVDRGLLVPLRRGDFSVQAHHDLHGLGADAARESLERFLVESRRQGRRCVLVVHGRGLHSKDQNPVLKERIGAWLTRGRLGHIVLAFATARPTDGGAGALYVLLRR